MSEAPKRIGLVFYRNGEIETYKDSFQPNPTVYVRADEIERLQAELREARYLIAEVDPPSSDWAVAAHAFLSATTFLAK